MRCKACNVLLSDREMRRKCKQTNTFLDLCDDCYVPSQEALHNAYEDNSEIIVDNYIDAMYNTSVDKGEY